MTRIIVHAGFHKTGTTSVQHFLLENGPHIWPSCAIVNQHRIEDVLRFALAYSTGYGPLALDEFKFRFADFLRGLNLGKKRNLCISAENIAGQMPGRSVDFVGYENTPVLMKTIEYCLREVFDLKLEIAFYFSTREKQDWLRSLWVHVLRKTRLTENLGEFCQRVGAGIDLDATIRDVQNAVPDCKVFSHSIEETKTLKFGPATPIVDYLGLDQLPFTPNKPQNISVPQTEALKFLALNRSGLPYADVKREKDKIAANNADGN